MAKNAVLHEQVIIDYMANRIKERALPLVQICKRGVITRGNKIYATSIEDGISSYFPDISRLAFRGKAEPRPAEIKMNTSLFQYHHQKKYAEKFQDFRANNGCIVVLKHDFLPQGLLSVYPDVDIFEIDYEDFLSYIRENLAYLLGRQLRMGTGKKIWIMQQSKNFWFEGSRTVQPAIKSGIWCPSDKITAFDLAVGDTVIFIRHQGVSYQKVSGYWKKFGAIIPGWYLTNVCISKVTEPIRSRQEYLIQKGLGIDTLLWYDETTDAELDLRVRHRGEAKWPYVFCFKPETNLSNLRVPLNQLEVSVPEFVNAVRETYSNHVSRRITNDTYINLLSTIAKMSLLEPTG